MTSVRPDDHPPVSPTLRVVIVIAMEVEAAPLRTALGAEPIESPPWAERLPCRLFAAPATDEHPEVLLALNGVDPISDVACIGTTAAALTTLVALDSGSVLPDLVLSVGTAGGWERTGAEIGDAYIAWPRFVCHDRRIALPGFDALGEGNLAAADLRAHATALGCRLGIVTTGDSLDESVTDRDRILASGAEVKEMEAVAVAWVCHLHGVPVSAVKAITDLVDSAAPTEEQFMKNLALASSALRDTTLALLDRLARSES